MKISIATYFADTYTLLSMEIIQKDIAEIKSLLLSLVSSKEALISSEKQKKSFGDEDISYLTHDVHVIVGIIKRYKADMVKIFFYVLDLIYFNVEHPENHTTTELEFNKHNIHNIIDRIITKVNDVLQFYVIDDEDLLKSMLTDTYFTSLETFTNKLDMLENHETLSTHIKTGVFNRLTHSSKTYYLK